ncbi:MAG TPA: hypothetical protein VFW50_09100 [Streptosporangiaceae bacterium]|nr:hypothetical protein [Streptosporangiaceae bacterium]
MTNAVLPLATGLGVHVGWQPLRCLFDMGFTRDAWVHGSISPAAESRIIMDVAGMLMQLG